MPASNKGPRVSGKAATAVLGILDTRYDSFVKKRIVTSHMVLHTWHNSKPNLGKNDSPLGCFQLTMAFVKGVQDY